MTTAEVETRPRFADLAARFAINGWQFWRTDPDDGRVRYFAAKWGRSMAKVEDPSDAMPIHINAKHVI